MATMTRTKTSKPARPFGLGILPPELPTLSIGRQTYTTERIRGQDGTRIVRLTKLSTGEAYDVARGATGPVTCDCGDYVWRLIDTEFMCKHGSACVSARLIVPPDFGPAPAVSPKASTCPATEPATYKPALVLERLPKPRDVRTEDEFYLLGFTLARDVVNACPCREWTGPIRVAFFLGFRDGARQLDADREATERLEHAQAESCD
jgi:hypothetical protein